MIFSCPLRAHAKNTEIGPARPEIFSVKTGQLLPPSLFGNDFWPTEPTNLLGGLKTWGPCFFAEVSTWLYIYMDHFYYSASWCTMLMSNYKHRMLMLQAELLREHSIHVNMQRLMYLSCTYAQMVHQTYHYICRCFQSMYNEGCTMPMYCESYVLYPNRINLNHFILVQLIWYFLTSFHLRVSWNQQKNQKTV